MKKLLTLISITTIVAVTACSNPGAGDNDVLSATEEAQTSVAETQTVALEPVCSGCDICETFERKFSVETHLNGQSIAIPIHLISVYDNCTVVQKKLYFAEKATKFIIDLNEDYDNTVTQIRNLSDIEWLAEWFNNRTLTSILQINTLGVSEYSETMFRVSFLVEFSNSSRSGWLCVELSEEDDFFVNDIYSYVA